MKYLKFLMLVFVLMLESCQSSHFNNEEQEAREQRLKKAAGYNTQLGLGYLKQGDMARAKGKLFMALNQDPKSPDVYSALAYYFEQTGQKEEAAGYYLKALKLSKSKGPQYNNYGAFLCRQKQYKNSIHYFLKAVEDKAYVHSAGAYENAGLCAEAIPDAKLAIAYFNKALEQDPNRRSSFYEIIKLENKLGQPKKIAALINKYPFFHDDAYVNALREKLKKGDTMLG